MCLYSFVHDYKTNENFFGPGLNSHSEVRGLIPNVAKRVNSLVDVEWPENGAMLIRAVTFAESRKVRFNILSRWPSRDKLVEAISNKKFENDLDFKLFDFTGWAPAKIYNHITQAMDHDYLTSELVDSAFGMLDNQHKFHATLNWKKLSTKILIEHFKTLTIPEAVAVGAVHYEKIPKQDRYEKFSKPESASQILEVMKQWLDLTFDDCVSLLKTVENTSFERACKAYLNISMV